MTTKKFYSLLLIGCILLTALAGCGTAGENETGEEISPSVLTNVYEGTELKQPENLVFNQFEYLYSGEKSLTFQACIQDDIGRHTVLLSYPIDGGDPVVLDHPAEKAILIQPTEDGFVYVLEHRDVSTFQSSYSLHRQMADGNTLTMEKLPGFNAELEGILLDGDGYIYVFDAYRILVLTPELKEAFAVTTDSSLRSHCVSEDGTVYVSYIVSSGENKRLVLAPIDKNAHCIGEPFALPDTVQAVGFMFGPDYDLYYFDYTGIYGWNIGDTEGGLLMHFNNSKITTTNFQQLVQAVIGEKFLLMYPEVSATSLMGYRNIYAIYAPAADVDLSEITVIDLALITDSMNLKMYINEFNRKHSDIQIVTKDYLNLNTPDNPYGGSTKLGNDILTGVYIPDMIYGAYSDNAVRTVIDNDLFLDLTPMLESGEILGKEDVWGCILNTFRKDNRIFGLPIQFSITGVIANREMLGERGGWTPAEMLEYIQTLPQGTKYMDTLTRSSAPAALFGPNGYAAFIDPETNTCSYDSETFIAYLEYLKSLPQTAEPENPNDVYAPYRQGTIAALAVKYTEFEEFLAEEMLFGEDNTLRIGYPTARGSNGMTVNRETPFFLVMQSAASPKDCLETIRYILEKDNMNFLSPHSWPDFPVLRAALEPIVEEYSTKYYKFYPNRLFDNVGSHNSRDISWNNGVKCYDIAFQFTETVWERIENFFDTMGTPIVGAVLPTEVSTIIEEEISAYLGSTKSAEACADMIQSRVSIYLAEHS